MKSKIIITALITACFLILFSGKAFFEHRVNSHVKEAYESQQLTLKQEEAKKKQLLDSLNPEMNKNQSIMDYLHYKSLTQPSVTISILGSSVAAGHGASKPELTWFKMLEKKIQSSNIDLRRVSIRNHGVGGYSTSDIIDHDVTDLVIQDKPDLVIFETSLLNDHGQSLSLRTTNDNISAVVSDLKKALPDTKILLISPNPAWGKDDKLNRFGFTYDDYLNETEKFIKGNGWLYANTSNLMLDKMKKEKVSIEDVLGDDGIHPNDKGYEIWFSVLYDYFNN